MRGYRSLFVPGIALAGMVALLAFGATDATAQSFNVVAFQCSGDSVRVDIRGLGNQNLCVAASAAITDNCACVNNQNGKCPQATNKGSFTSTDTGGVSVEPKNGRLNTTLSPSDANIDLSPSCSDPGKPELVCGSGQTLEAISQTVNVSWTVCTTDLPAGQPCSCPAGSSPNLATTGSCGPATENIDSPDRSCLRLF